MIRIHLGGIFNHKMKDFSSLNKKLRKKSLKTLKELIYERFFDHKMMKFNEKQKQKNNAKRIIN